jgi:hypothetical protein
MEDARDLVPGVDYPRTFQEVDEAEEEACEYAAVLNDHCGGKLCKPQALSRVQSFGLIVLVTANTS